VKLSNCNLLIRTVCVGFCLLFVFQSAIAQSGASIPKDDPELYIGVFKMIDTLHNSGGKDSSHSSAEVDAALERDMKISSVDFAVILQEAALANNSIWEGGGSGRALAGESRRREVVTILHRLEKSLSPTGLTNFRAFVNGNFRASSFRN
jgi:hypothetical protein